jgi:hypothetical protein
VDVVQRNAAVELRLAGLHNLNFTLHRSHWQQTDAPVVPSLTPAAIETILLLLVKC